MKKIAATLFFLTAVGLGAAEPEIWYVNGWGGWQSGKGSIDRTLVLLEDFFPSAQLRVVEWDSTGAFHKCARAADAFVGTLVRRISELPEARRRNLILIGHSFGGRIAVRTTAELSRRNIAIREAVFLAAAIPADDRDCVTAFRQRLTPCTNIYCTKDETLKKAYRVFGAGRHALGAIGYAVDGFHHQYCKESAGHGRDGYLECLKARLRTPSDPPVRLELKILYGCKPVPTIFDKGELIDRYRDWRLYRNGFYMIIDPMDRIRAFGTKKQMRESFDDIKRQLKSRGD